MFYRLIILHGWRWKSYANQSLKEMSRFLTGMDGWMNFAQAGRNVLKTYTDQ